MTHFARALDALNIEIICANSPQAKGRVERANGTLQDRLVKAMRLAGISTIAEANAFPSTGVHDDQVDALSQGLDEMYLGLQGDATFSVPTGRVPRGNMPAGVGSVPAHLQRITRENLRHGR